MGPQPITLREAAQDRVYTGPAMRSGYQLWAPGRAAVRLAFAVALAVVALLGTGCPGSKLAPNSARKAEERTPKQPEPERVAWQVSKSGLGFRLSNAEPLPSPKAGTARPVALSAEQTAQVLERLPQFKAPAVRKRFSLRAKYPAVASMLSVTFSQTMVELTSHDTIAKQPLPLRPSSQPT